jgi:myo-inositol 2-dehydrogenase / D-chiro-inositol 1-dehydrogenase
MRVAVLGAGRMGRWRAELLARSPDVREIVIGNRSRSNAEKIATKIGGQAVSLEEALDCRPDAVVVTVATKSHPELVGAALELEVPVFCEKPLTGDLAASEALVAEVDRRRVVVQMGYHRRFDPEFVGVREAVLAGDVGRLYSLSVVSHDHRLPPTGFIEGSGGTFRDLHVHDFDLARWVTGLEVETICAAASVRADDTFRQFGDVDITAMMATLTGGVLVTVRARHNARGHDVRLEVHGSRDSIAAGLDRRTPLRTLGTADRLFCSPAYDDFLDRFERAFAAETAAFIDVVAGRRENPCPPGEDLAAFRAVLACERSVSSGTFEHLGAMQGVGACGPLKPAGEGASR